MWSYHACICMYCRFFSPTTRKPQPRPQNTLLWGSTAFRAPQSMCANTYFAIGVPHGGPILHNPARSTRPMPLRRPSDSAGPVPWTHPRSPQGRPPGRSGPIDPLPCPVSSDLACWSCPSSERPPLPLKKPSQP
jgi:hypothetical protein